MVEGPGESGSDQPLARRQAIANRVLNTPEMTRHAAPDRQAAPARNPLQRRHVSHRWFPTVQFEGETRWPAHRQGHPGCLVRIGHKTESARATYILVYRGMAKRYRP